MKKKGQGGVFAVFLVPIITVILLGIIWSTVQTATVPTSVTNESFTGIENTDVALTYDDWAAVSAVRNATNDAVTVTTGYVADLSSGSINITTAGGGNGTYYADYTYKEDSYMESSTSRMVTGYIPLLAAVVIFVFIAGFIVMKKRSE